MYPKRDLCQHYSKNYQLSLKISLPNKTHLQGEIAIGDWGQRETGTQAPILCEQRMTFFAAVLCKFN